MNQRTYWSAFGALGAVLAGCGAIQNWNGTYVGTVVRELSATPDAGVAAQDTWTIDQRSGGFEVKRSRGQESVCTLRPLELNGRTITRYPGGGYSLGMAEGISCQLDGRDLVLLYGGIGFAGPGEDYDVELRWGAAPDAGVTVLERGLLHKR